MTPRRAAFHWSGGKDSALALSRLLGRDDVNVDRLLTTVHPERSASTVHGVPIELLQAQADSIGIPLQTVAIAGQGLDGYTAAMEALAADLRSEGIDAFAFGDLSSSGVLALKQKQFAPYGIDVLEPLWGLSSRECVDEFLDSGIRAVTIVVDATVLAADDVGIPLDRDFVNRLPPGADPCGELGEYHSFVYDGTLFRRPIAFTLTPVRRLERQIRTTEGLRSYAYWLATPEQPRTGAQPTNMQNG